MTDVTNPNGGCLFVCVVGPGFDSASPGFVRSIASQAGGSDGRLAQKRNRAHISGGRDFVDILCADICSIPASCMLCVLGTHEVHPKLHQRTQSLNNIQKPHTHTTSF